MWVGSMGAALIHQATECESDHHSSSSSPHRDTSRADKAVRAMLSSRVFAIDVGHRMFRATEQTLRSESGSVLDRMFSGEYELPRDSYHLGFAHLDRQDDLHSSSTTTTTNHTATSMNDRRDRRVFIDCDPQSFEHVLHWLRSYVLCFSLSLRVSLRVSLNSITNDLDRCSFVDDDGDDNDAEDSFLRHSRNERSALLSSRLECSSSRSSNQLSTSSRPRADARSSRPSK